MRSYLVHAPPSYSGESRWPVLLALHGRFGTSQEMRDFTRLDEVADRHGFLVAYPQALGQGFSALVCCGTEDDVGFIGALLQHLEDSWNADPDRMYATGFSNGADMAYLLAAELPGRFAAIAPISGGLIGPGARENPAAAVPDDPVSLLQIAGKEDDAYGLYLFGVRTWLRQRSCPGLERVPYEASKRIDRSVSHCPDGTDAVVYAVEGMGHEWPGGRADLPFSDAEAPISATRVMWRFFESHPRLSG